MKVQWIEHKGNKVLFANFKDVKKEDEMIVILNLYTKMTLEVEETVLSLIDVTGSATGPDFMKEAKLQAKESGHKICKSSIIGITGLKGMLLKAYNMFSGQEMKPFETKEEALDYLTS